MSFDARQAALQLKCHEDLYFYSRYMFASRKKYKWARNWHHQQICDTLQKTLTGEITRLIINVPPRYSKTELAVVNYIGWALGKHPDSEFIYTSYSGSLASKYGAQVRDIAQTIEYQSVFADVALKKEGEANWGTTAGGIVYSVGAGGTITGFGAGKDRDEYGGAIIVDDPHKASEAGSDTMRRKVCDWYVETLASRVNDTKRTPIILIMQRLHEDDLTGFLLSGGSSEMWHHLCLPAQSGDMSYFDKLTHRIPIDPYVSDYDALWPRKHTAEKLEKMEKAHPYAHAGQYGQRPAPLSGGAFDTAMIDTIDAIPAGHIDWIRSWDFASSDSKNADRTAGAKVGKTKDGTIIIADMYCERVLTDKRDAAIKNIASQDGPSVKIRIPQDPGAAGKSQVHYLVKNQLQGYSVIAKPEQGGKSTRADPFASQVNVGNVKMLRGEWNKGFLDELKLFPMGKHDDQVDAAANGYNEFNDKGSTGMLDFYRDQANLMGA